MKCNVVIAVDDVHPEEGWGYEGDIPTGYLNELHSEFGCKFTLFVPSNYHKKFPLSEYKDWVEYWKSKDWIELAAHGHFHQCERTDIGECEFWELDTTEKAQDRIKLMLNEWEAVNHKPSGWRNPGWVGHPVAVKELGKHFKYSAVHYQHNNNLKWDCKTFFGGDGINTNDIKIHNGNTIMFQSHIAGEWNDNIWSERNFNQMRLSLDHLVKNMNVKFKTLNEL
jgi:hypothetical protein